MSLVQVQPCAKFKSSGVMAEIVRRSPLDRRIVRQDLHACEPHSQVRGLYMPGAKAFKDRIRSPGLEELVGAQA